MCPFDQILDEIYLQHLSLAPAPHSSEKLECFCVELLPTCTKIVHKKGLTAVVHNKYLQCKLIYHVSTPSVTTKPYQYNAPPTSTSSPPFCFSFNNNVACKPNCSYKHVCRFCRSLKHWGNSCPAKPIVRNDFLPPQLNFYPPSLGYPPSFFRSSTPPAIDANFCA